jgi:hypothetical protein
MSEEKKNIIPYTLTDIEQYLQGKLSPVEMHALEKAALQDPFLADAIEGYQPADLLQAKKDIKDIRNRLLEEDREETKAILISLQKSNWWKIAALIILLAGIGTFVWQLLIQPNNNKELVRQPIQTMKKDSVKANLAGTITTDTLQFQKEKNITAVIIPKDQSLKKNITPTLQPPGIQEEIADAKILHLQDTLLVMHQPIATKEATETNISSLVIADNLSVAGTISGGVFSGTLSAGSLNSITSLGNLSALTVNGETAMVIMGNHSKPLHAFNGRVIDEKTANPVPGASIILTGTNHSLLTDTNGNFAFKSNDTIQKIRINSVGFEEKETLAKTLQPTEIQLKESTQALNEVVVTGSGTVRKKDLTGSVTNTSLTLPDGGWADLLNYLKKKIVAKYSGANIHGSIIVELALKNSKVKNAVILQTFNRELDKILITALKHGPKWRSSVPPGNKEKRTVAFKL